MPHRGTERPARRRELGDRVVRRERDRPVEALPRGIEGAHHLAHGLDECTQQRADLVGGQPLRTAVEGLVRATEGDRHSALHQQRAQAQRRAEIGLDPVDRRAVRPARQRVDRARRASKQVVHRGRPGLVAVVRRACVAGEQPSNLARRRDQADGVPVGESERLEPSDRRRRQDRLVRTRKVEGREIDPGGLHPAQKVRAPAVDERAHERLASTHALGDARRVHAEPPRTLREPGDMLAVPLARGGAHAEGAQQHQADPLVRAAVARGEILRREVERDAARKHRARIGEQRVALVRSDPPEAASARVLGGMPLGEKSERLAVDLDALAPAVLDPVRAEPRATPALERLRRHADLTRERLGRRRPSRALVWAQGDPLGEVEDQRREIGAERTAADNLAGRRGDLGSEHPPERLAERVVGPGVDCRDERLGREHLPPRRVFRRVRRLRWKRLHGRKGVGCSSRHRGPEVYEVLRRLPRAIRPARARGSYLPPEICTAGSGQADRKRLSRPRSSADPCPKRRGRGSRPSGPEAHSSRSSSSGRSAD